MEEMAKNTKFADPDFVKACVKTLALKFAEKLDSTAFHKNCDELEMIAHQLSREPRNMAGPLFANTD
jgi:ribosomal protein S17E